MPSTLQNTWNRKTAHCAPSKNARVLRTFDVSCDSAGTWLWMQEHVQASILCSRFSQNCAFSEVLQTTIFSKSSVTWRKSQISKIHVFSQFRVFTFLFFYVLGLQKTTCLSRSETHDFFAHMCNIGPWKVRKGQWRDGNDGNYACLASTQLWNFWASKTRRTRTFF